MRALALFALTGCTQIFGLGDPVKQMPVDAEVTDTAVMQDAAIDTFAPSCEPDQSLIACFDFDGEIVDHSQVGNVVTAIANVDYGMAGGPDGTFARVSATSAITIAASTVFNTSAFTIAAWVNLEALPAASARVGVFDSDGRYGIFIDSTGSMVVRGVTSSTAITLGTWTHLAVTDNGVTMVFYVNGIAVTSASAVSAVPTSNLASEIAGNAPTGDRMTGSIDKLRVYRRVLSPLEIAAQVL